ncbi:MAG TPA: NAD(P)-binding protein [Polyangiaceae bacterium]|nr:NAD(P)-binding protein [Polyangiaceae bacterium]
MMRRRELISALAAGWLAERVRDEMQGAIVGASHTSGHRLRGPLPPARGPSERADVVIVGSGVSGASAAWRLAAAGVEARMLELESFAGGTSAWSDDGAVPHPWGAHYLPAPEADARATQRLLVELGVQTGWDAAGRPLFVEEMLCHAPQERLFYGGHWHGGLIPDSALEAREREELDRFMALTNTLQNERGSDGRFAFALPAEQSSRDARFLELDRTSMAEWLVRERFASPFLRWFVEYATLDDFGANLEDTSAWAGLHYFAARKLETEQLQGSRYLVWPEGNGWLVRRMLERMHGTRHNGALVFAVTPSRSGVSVDYLDVHDDVTRRIEARAVVLAVPAFVAARMLSAKALTPRASSPWLVANLHVDGRHEPDRTWDTMIHAGLGLGYVDAGHQRTAPSDRTVLTYFRAFGDADVGASRARLIRQSWHELASEVLRDLITVHPDLPAQTHRLDIMLWGHAMPRPRPGFLGPKPFEPTVMLDDRIAWAHVDQTGFALFEEANLHGVRAAEHLLRTLDASVGESWI